MSERRRALAGSSEWLGDLVTVAAFEFRRHVTSRRFLTATVGIPLAAMVMLAGALWLARLAAGPDRPWVMVGQGADRLPGTAGQVSLEADAEAGVIAGDLGGYVVLRKDGRALARAGGDVPPELAAALMARARASVVGEAPEAARERLLAPAEVTYVTAGSRLPPASARGLFGRSAAAVALPLLFALAVLASSSYLVLAVSEEKEGRVVEVLATSIRDSALVGGKVVGLAGVSLVQTGTWALAVVGAGVLTGRLRDVPEVPWGAVGLSLPYFVLGYLLYAALMLCVGVALGAPREAQQVAGFLGLFLTLPFVFVGLLVVRPSSPAAVALSVWPMTAPVAMPMRLIMGVVPGDTYVFGLVVLAICLAAGVFAAGRIYGAARLMYGQRLSGAALLSALAAAGK